jgi:hypothetical protein
MNLSRETIQRLERDHGFGAGPLETVVRLGDLARQINTDPTLAGRLVLKGGSALNLCFGVPTRLSVDLDFNDIGTADREAMMRDRPMVVAALERSASRAGYRVQRSRNEHAGQKFFLPYASALGNEARLQIDLNFMHRVPVEPIVRRRLWSPQSDGEIEIDVVAGSELVAGKMLALLDRSAARDLYDVARIADDPSRFGIGSEAQARRIFIVMSAVLNHPLTSYGQSRIERIADEAVRATLHPLLRSDERPTVLDLKRSATPLISRWLNLSPVERKYTDRIQVGDLRPELLFPDDPDMVERLNRHPALLWKVENARRHATRKG